MDAKPSYDEPSAREMTDSLLHFMKGVNGQAFRLFGNKVISGPFSGMIVPERTPWADGNSSTKLLGSYETELHGAIEHALWRKPGLVVDVGCSEGYYAIGFARLGLSVIALDTDSASRQMCEDYAIQNEVGESVQLYEGAREPEELRFEWYKGHRLYVVDVEGDEEKLIDLDRCPELARSDLIIECHDFLKPDISSVIADRLSVTHRVELIYPRLPDFTRYRFMARYPTLISVLMLLEKRPMPCHWLACWANRKVGPHPHVGD